MFDQPERPSGNSAHTAAFENKPHSFSHALPVETMSADESARSTASDALLRELFSGSSTAATATVANDPMATTAFAVCDDAFADLQADLDAFDALIGSSEHDEGLFFYIDDAATANEQATTVACASDICTSGDESSSDASNTVMTSASDGDVEAAAVVKKAKCAPGGNAARKRQREEIHALRESAGALERELQALKAIAGASTLSSALNSSSSSDALGQKEPQQRSSVQSSKKPPTSKKLLAKEKEARQKAERKNNQLSRLVSDHIAITQRFKKALFTRRMTTSSEMFLELTRPTLAKAALAERISKPHTASDSSMFEGLGKNIDTQHLELERVFQVAGLTDCRTNRIETRVNTEYGEAGGMATLTFKSSHLFPFSMQAIDALTLKNVGKRYGANQGNWKSESFQKEFQVGDMTINMRNIGKRHSENDRIVLVWEGLNEWLDKASGELMTIHEKGWSIIQSFSEATNNKKKKNKPQQLQQSSSTLPLSRMQSYVYMTAKPPTCDSANRKQETRMAAYRAIFSNVVKPLYESQFATRIQDLENVLLDESLNWKLVAS